jgi:hypothetical protein
MDSTRQLVVTLILESGDFAAMCRKNCYTSQLVRDPGHEKCLRSETKVVITAGLFRAEQWEQWKASVE